MLLENHPLTEVSLIMFVLVQLKCNGQQTWHFGTFRGRVYLGWNYNTFKSHRDRAGTEGVIEITLETG